MYLGAFKRVAAAAIFLAGAGIPAAHAASEGVLRLYHTNTRETLDIVYKRGGSYDKAALKKLNWFFRDWRSNEAIGMDPRVLDVLADVQKQSGSNERANVHGGYRSPETNAMLRRTSTGVARESQHMKGRAIDFHIPGVSTKKLREIAIRVQGGGVGYYPKSRSPFVHIDVGGVRYWPTPDRQYLASILRGKSKSPARASDPVPAFNALVARSGSKDMGLLAVIGGTVSRKRRQDGAAAQTTLVDRMGPVEIEDVPIPARRPSEGAVHPTVMSAFATTSPARASERFTAITTGSKQEPKATVVAAPERKPPLEKRVAVRVEDMPTIVGRKSGRIRLEAVR